MTQKIVLASGSPRRKQLMGLIPVSYEVIVENTDEYVDENKSPQENVIALAAQKAEAVAKRHQDRWIVGCDTVVVCEGKILGKPKDEEDATVMLMQLSGKTHQVLTGACLMHEGLGEVHSFVEATKVHFKHMTTEEIAYYVATKEPMDKAGAYGIQGYASVFIQGIEGDYYNVMGLPVHRLYEILKKLNLLNSEKI
ncbi:MAG: Maf family protein [Cellulosilyticaceae bacterium]